LLALKLQGNQRHTQVMSAVLDEGLALFAGLNVIPDISTTAFFRRGDGHASIWRRRLPLPWEIRAVLAYGPCSRALSATEVVSD
jgi:hypothetical protein